VCPSFISRGQVSSFLLDRDDIALPALKPATTRVAAGPFRADAVSESEPASRMHCLSHLREATA
jgi:hypothetical protein